MVDHLNKFQTVINKLLSIGVKVEDEDKVIILLNSLQDDWDHMVVTITNSSIRTPKFDDVVVALLGEKFEEKSSLKPSTSVALSVKGQSSKRGQQGRSQSNSKSKGHNKGRCWNCGKPKHSRKVFRI